MEILLNVREFIGKTVAGKNVGRTLVCPRIWSTSEYSKKPLANQNVGSLLFRDETLLRISLNVRNKG